MGSTPNSSLWVSMKSTISCVGGRAPPPKKLAALFRISLARFSSRISCSSTLTRWDSAVDTPAAYPSSMSAWRTQERTDSTR